MSSMIELRDNAEAEGIKLGAAAATIGIAATGLADRVEDVVVTGSYSAGDVVATNSYVHITGVDSNPTYAAVVLSTADYGQVSHVTSHDSIAGCAVRVSTSINVAVSSVTSFQDENGLVIELGSHWFSVSDYHVIASDGNGVLISGSDWGTFDGIVDQVEGHGVALTTASSNRISGQFFNNGIGTNNTFDNINLSGISSRNFITGAVFRSDSGSPQTRSAVNVGGTGECNMIAGNDLGDPNDYGTDAIIDTASNTQLFWPADATYGDNFTDCGTGS